MCDLQEVCIPQGYCCQNNARASKLAGTTGEKKKKNIKKPNVWCACSWTTAWNGRSSGTPMSPCALEGPGSNMILSSVANFHTFPKNIAQIMSVGKQSSSNIKTWREQEQPQSNPPVRKAHLLAASLHPFPFPSHLAEAFEGLGLRLIFLSCQGRCGTHVSDWGLYKCTTLTKLQPECWSRPQWHKAPISLFGRQIQPKYKETTCFKDVQVKSSVLLIDGFLQSRRARLRSRQFQADCLQASAKIHRPDIDKLWLMTNQPRKHKMVRTKVDNIWDFRWEVSKESEATAFS